MRTMQAGYLLREVLETHPGMKVVITREVERFLFRPGLQERARYYGVIFLNQMPLSHNAAQGKLGWLYGQRCLM
jgi:ribosome biogenesis protein MAK21